MDLETLIRHLKVAQMGQDALPGNTQIMVMTDTGHIHKIEALYITPQLEEKDMNNPQIWLSLGGDLI